MYLKRYFHINKYCALAFMMFAILSGVSEDYDKTNTASVINNDSSYFLSISQLLKNNIKNIRLQFSVNNSDFSLFLHSIAAADDDIAPIVTAMSLAALFFVIFYSMNKILRNSIWRKTVF